MIRIRSWYLPGLCALALSGACAGSSPSPAQVERGRYLVTIGGCNDCHTPKLMTAMGPVMDSARMLSGHPAEEAVTSASAALAGTHWEAATNGGLTAWSGPWGVSFTANLTPDRSGLAGWTEEVFIRTIREGRHAGVGRPLLPPMPWTQYAHMTDDDLRAVFAYLQSLRPVSNLVPAPMPPGGGSDAAAVPATIGGRKEG